MRNFILFLLIIAGASIANAQSCSELFISEYAEGSGNNKAIEVYNPTSDTIDLSDYSIVRYRNGLGVAGTPTYMGGMLMPYETYVVVLDKRNQAGTGNEAPISDSLESKADTFVTPNYDNGVHALYMNGNDAIALRKHNGGSVELIDQIGVQDQPVDDAWSTCPPYTGAGLWVTANKNLVRRDSVTEGVKTNPTEFIGTTEWVIYPSNTVVSLGCHESICDANASTKGCQYAEEVIPNPCTSSILDLGNGHSLLLFPNPAKDRLTIKGSRNVTGAMVYDMQGRMVKEIQSAFPNTSLSVDLDLPSGMYQVRVQLEMGRAYNLPLMVD